MKRATRPFQFVAASYLTRIRTERAWTLGELGGCLRKVPDSSIFFHTFQSLESHHYTAFSNDFAQWTAAACNEAVLAEDFGAIDLRDFVALSDLRHTLADTMEKYLKKNPQSADRPAFEPFYFCDEVELSVPIKSDVYTLAELADGIAGLSLQSLHYHFINSRLRLHLSTNDFSNWIESALGFTELAQRLERVDLYTNTLEGVRNEILRTIKPWVQR